MEYQLGALCSTQVFLVNAISSIAQAARSAHLRAREEIGDVHNLEMAMEVGRFVGNTGAMTLMGVGAFLVAAPFILGKGWISKALFVWATILGCLGSGAVLMDAEFFRYRLEYFFGTEAACGMSMVLVIISGIVFGISVMKFAIFWVFWIGAATGAIVAVLITGLFASNILRYNYHSHWHHFDEDPFKVFLGTSAFVSGVLFVKYSSKFLDVVLGILGSLLVAQATLQLALVNDYERFALPLYENYEMYILMLSAAIYGARALFVRYATSGSLAATAPDGAAGRKQNNNERLIMR